MRKLKKKKTETKVVPKDHVWTGLDPNKPVGNGNPPHPPRGYRPADKNGNPVCNKPNRKPALLEQMDESADTVMKLISDIKDKLIDPRDISPRQRQCCLMLLINGKSSTNDLAAVFKVSPATIRKDIRILRQSIGREVREWTLDEVIGQFMMVSDKLTAAAMKQEDIGLAWTIQRDTVKTLKDVGVIGQDKKSDSLTITIEAIGDGYDRATDVLYGALNPDLTGEVLRENGKDNFKSNQTKPIALPLKNTVPNVPEVDPNIHIDLAQAESNTSNTIESDK